MGIDLIRHRLQGTTVEFYDCAGQVDYAGMQQTFLSRRALYLVVWDVRRCHGEDGKALGGEALDEVGCSGQGLDVFWYEGHDHGCRVQLGRLVHILLSASGVGFCPAPA